MATGWLARELPEVIERVRGCGGELQLQLQRRGAHYEIIYNGVFLMASYNGASERAAVRRGLALLRHPAAPPLPAVTSPAGAAPACPPAPLRILMGGLGMGFSLQEALSAAPPGSRVVVAEIEPAVIRWNRTVLAPLNGAAACDQRVTIFPGPFQDLLAREAARTGGGPAGYHFALCDTDNGSSWLSRPENAAIYSDAGLELLYRCLVPGGAAAFWCCRREPELEERLTRRFGPPRYETVPEATGHEAGFYICSREGGAQR